MSDLKHWTSVELPERLIHKRISWYLDEDLQIWLKANVGSGTDSLLIDDGDWPHWCLWRVIYRSYSDSSIEFRDRQAALLFWLKFGHL